VTAIADGPGRYIRKAHAKKASPAGVVKEETEPSTRKPCQFHGRPYFGT